MCGGYAGGDNSCPDHISRHSFVSHSSIPVFQHSRIPGNRYRVYSGVDHSCNSQWAEFPAKPLSGKGQCPPQNNFVAQWAIGLPRDTSVAGGCPLRIAGTIGKKKCRKNRDYMEEDITGFWANYPEVRARVGHLYQFLGERWD